MGSRNPTKTGALSEVGDFLLQCICKTFLPQLPVSLFNTIVDSLFFLCGLDLHRLIGLEVFLISPLEVLELVYAQIVEVVLFLVRFPALEGIISSHEQMGNPNIDFGAFKEVVEEDLANDHPGPLSARKFVLEQIAEL